MAFALCNTFLTSIMASIHDNYPAYPMGLHAQNGDSLSSEVVETFFIKVKLMMIQGLNVTGQDKLSQSLAFLEMALNSEEFKARVLNFKNQKGEKKYSSNNGLTNEQIYQLLMDGREILQPNTPGEMNLYIKLYNNPLSKVIGYTTSETNVINVNYKFFKNYSPQEVAANLTHEWIHKLGFDHQSAKEHDSVPYALGYIVKDLVKKMLLR